MKSLPLLSFWSHPVLLPTGNQCMYRCGDRLRADEHVLSHSFFPKCSIGSAFWTVRDEKFGNHYIKIVENKNGN